MVRDRISRRRVLQVGGGVVAGAMASGHASASLTDGADDDSVTVNVGYSASSGRQAAVDAADEVVYVFSFDALTIVTSRSEADDLSQRSDIRYVELDGAVQTVGETALTTDDLTGTASDGSGSESLPWGIDRVDAEAPHHGGDTGSGAHIAIVDTGIDQFHADLSANLGEGTAFLGGVQHPDWQDDNGHGTHCAGIADAVDNDLGVVGVSTEATLHAVKVLTAAGAGLTSDVAAGVEWTADQGYDVASLSLGGEESNVLHDAVKYADNNGVLVVAAAGNAGPCTDCVGYPAAHKEAVAVSATTENDSLADFSSQGPEVELAAPGDSIFSTFTGNAYATLSGTSMACPHVSGAAGLLMANGYSNSQARNQLTSSAEDIGLSANEQGAGLLDAAAALGYDSSDDLGGSDGGSGGSDGGSAPSAAIDDVSEVESKNPHAEFDVTWSASDADGDLDNVTVQLLDTTDGGATEDQASVDVSGGNASDTTRLKAHKDDGAGHDYEVRVHVRDAAGNTDTATATVTENGTSSSKSKGNGKK